MNFFKKLRSVNPVAEIWQTISLPDKEGEIAHKRLQELGFRAQLVSDKPDKTVFEKIQVFLSGADAVASNSFINKTGTRFIATTTGQMNKQVIVIADPRKFVGDESRYKTINEHMGDLFEEIPRSLVTRLMI
jgi:translation initiation factor 2B subunit (eIF-2B alpha/beta/delta family)